MRNRSTSLAALLLASVFAASSPAAAQDYPKKQIELVVPFVAGGTTDNVARLIAQRFSESWGQTVIVNNRPGGGSTIGHAVVAKAPPDGHTLLVTTISFAITAVMQKLPFDPIKDFAPISEFASLPLILVVHPSRAGDQPQGIHRDGEVEAGRMGLRLLRRRHLAAPRRRDVQVDGRRRPGARALQGQRRGHERVSGRPHQDLLRPGAGGAAARQGREPAADRRHHRAAAALSSGCADHRRIRLSRLRDQLVAGRVRARRHPERRRRQDQRRSSCACSARPRCARASRSKAPTRSAARPMRSPSG